MKNYLKILFVLAAVGALFTGYLSWTVYFTGICGFNEPCPFFLGYPACYVDFAIFLVLLVIAALGWKGVIPMKNTYQASMLFAALGTLFSGRIGIAQLLYSKVNYPLDVSTCLYGLLFYIAVLWVSAKAMRGSGE